MDSTVAILRRILFIILLVGLIGTIAEMVLLGHTEGFWQLFPLWMLVAAVPVQVWSGAWPSPLSLRSLQGLMIIFAICGVWGVVLHYQGNAVYEMESMPGIGGRDLFLAALEGATPTLAPGTMLQLGLVGLAYTFRHPGFKRGSSDRSLS